jgi:putative two-component system response regulator
VKLLLADDNHFYRLALEATLKEWGYEVVAVGAILNKSGPLTDTEYEIIKEHPGQGVKMVEALQSLADVIPMIRWHHERLDGSGYPDGLRGDQIPLLVRLLSIADCYDAMVSPRPYRGGLPHAECLRRLRADAARGRLDGALVEHFAAATPPSTAEIALPVPAPEGAPAVLQEAV